MTAKPDPLTPAELDELERLVPRERLYGQARFVDLAERLLAERNTLADKLAFAEKHGDHWYSFSQVVRQAKEYAELGARKAEAERDALAKRLAEAERLLERTSCYLCTPKFFLVEQGENPEHCDTCKAKRAFLDTGKPKAGGA